MKKLLILFFPIILFAQRPEGFRGTNGISMVDIRIAIGDSNIVSLQGTTPDTAKIQGNYPLKLSGLRVTGNAKFESNVVMSTIAGEQIKAGAGTAALPQYSASADTNTGLYLDGADGLGLSTAGVQRLGISSTGMTTYSQTAIGATLDTTKSIRLVNTTAAAAGAQQVSPGLILSSQGWKTDATASPIYTQWAIYNLPVQGASAPTAKINFDYRVGSGSFANRFSFSSAGSFTAYGTVYANNGNSYMNQSAIYGADVAGYSLVNASNGPLIFKANNTEWMRLLAIGKLGLGTATPLNSFSLVDATSGQGTGIHVVSSQWNKARATWAAAHDTSSIMQYIDSAGGPRLSLKAVDGDSIGITDDGTTTLIKTSNPVNIYTAGATRMVFSATNQSSVNFYPGSDDARSLGGVGYRWKDGAISDNIYLGGKSQTATMTISGENVIAGTDSALVLSALNGVPTISAMHTGTFTNGGRRFYTGADTLLLVNGAKTGRDSTLSIGPAGNIVTTSSINASGSIFTTGGSLQGNILQSYSTNTDLKLTTPTAGYDVWTDRTFGVNTSSPGAQAEINGNKSADTLLIVRNDRVGSPYDSVFTVLSNGNMGSNGVVTIKRSVSLTDAGEYTPQIPAGMCGWGTVQAGDNQEFARFRFTSAGVVTLEANSTNVSSTNDNDTTMNVYDAGASGIVIENQLGSTLKFAVVIECYTP